MEIQRSQLEEAKNTINSSQSGYDEGSKENKKMKESQEFPRDYIRDCDKNAVRYVDNKSHSDKISGVNEKHLIGNWSKGSPCHAAAMKLAAMFPCSRDLWR